MRALFILARCIFMKKSLLIALTALPLVAHAGLMDSLTDTVTSSVTSTPSKPDASAPAPPAIQGKRCSVGDNSERVG